MPWQTRIRRIFGLSGRAEGKPAQQEAGAGQQAQPVREELSVAALLPAPTQEDWYWGRMSAGTEEDYLWRRLSDNWYQKDTQPAIYLELHNECYEAYCANPLASTIVETITNFTLGRGLIVSATNRRVQRVLDAFWRDPDNHMDAKEITVDI